MHIKSLAIAAAMVATFAVSQAEADNIDVAQFGPDETTLASPITRVTADGVGFTLVGASTFTRKNQGTDWHGNFYNGAAPLFDGFNPGKVVI